MKHIEHMIKESLSRTRVKNLIYKEIEKRGLTSKLYKDEYWQGVADIRKAIADVFEQYHLDWTYSIYPDNGGYRKSKDGMSQWKAYNVEIYSMENGNEVMQLRGTLNCSAAGSVDDPFDRYDMTFIISAV